MKAWLKMLIGGICILTILMNLIPEGKFTKYVRFYAGLLFFLMTVSPVLKFFAGEGELERLLQLEFLKEDYYDLETAVDGMSELKNDQICAAYQQELTRQVREIAAAYGISSAEAQISFDPADGYTPVGVEIRIMDQNPGGKEAEHGTKVGLAGQGKNAAAEDSLTEAESREAARKIRQEISAVYGLEMNRIAITGQGGTRM